MNQLVTIRFSHYNEKARWALDRFGVPYDEQGYMPLLHMVGVLPIALRHRKGRQDRLSSPLSTPVLVTDAGDCLHDSAKIVRWASDHYAPPGQGLYPTDEVAALEERFAVGFGAHSRRVAYFYAFTDAKLLRQVARANVSPRQASWFRLVQPLAERLISKGLKVDKRRGERSLAFCRQELADVGKLLDGKRYLVADRFTAADLALACMMAPLILPSPEEGYGAVFPAIDDCPPAFAAIIREARDTEAGRFALRMFREERPRRMVPAAA